jgi:peptidylprolyl isomerase
MPPSKQARARQAKQKDRLAAAAVRRQERRRRRRRAGATALIFIVVLVVVLAVVLAGVNSGGSSNKASSPTTVAPTTPPTTVAALASVKGKPCVALKDPVPPPFSSVPLQAGPPPATLVTKDLKVGTGAEVKADSKVTADYVGVACSTGKIFDSSAKEGGPQQFTVNQTIQGWIDGVPGMKVGGVRLLGIPSEQAYKAQGAPQVGIAPDETLWFVVQVNAVN